jgi:putative ABC transport system permease protein
MALGAEARHVLRLVIGQGMSLVCVGVVAGLILAYWLTKWLSGWLYGVGGADPLTYGSIALLLAVVALLSCWIPARRATKVDPMIALRCE